MSNAMAGSTWLEPQEDWAVSVNAGDYNGFNAFAVTGALRVDSHISVNAGVGFSEDGREWGGRVGVRIGGSFGPAPLK
jgi:trimeric autotransporter adhesin